MIAISESRTLTEALATGARSLAPHSLQARAFAAATEALHICEIVCGQWGAASGGEDAIIEAASEFADRRWNAANRPTDDEWSTCLIEQSRVDDDWFRVRVRNQTYLIEQECEGDVSGGDWTASYSYHVRLEGWL